MVIVILCFCPVMAVLMGVLYRFYGTQGFGPEDRSVKPGEVARADGPTAPCDAEGADGPLERRLCFACAHGLSDRETEVFLLLAQGRSRRFIADELFITEGTVSKHSQRTSTKKPGGSIPSRSCSSVVLDRRDEAARGRVQEPSRAVALRFRPASHTPRRFTGAF